MNPFDVFLVYPIINVLIAIYHLLIALHIPYALGFSIIVLTVLMRVALYPFTATQLKAAKKMQGVSHHVANLKEKHKGDAKRIQAETMKLYKEHGINPAAGCLPILIQIPIIWGLYSVLQQAVSVSPSAALAHINQIVYFPILHLDKTWDPTFFGVPLGQGPSNLFSTMGPVVILVPIITGALQYVQSKMMLPQVDKDAKKLQKKNDDFATTFQNQSTYIFPIMIAFVSYTFPMGMSLYWNTFSIFGIIQQYKISGWGGLMKKKG
ncbi:MAG: YidC/Oxa1 family membrane protein insertase [Candidatus Levyibacteriota bacterium]